MTSTQMSDLFTDAVARGVAVGAFNVIALEHAEGIVAAAEQAGRPVVLQLSENTVKYHAALAPLAAACTNIARAAAVPVCVHLDHATERELVEEAVQLGIHSVMIDASALAYDENVAHTAELAAWCHARGVFVEAELGEIGGKDGAHAPGVRTDPGDAAAFVEATGVDSLAVAVGSSHAMRTKDAVLDDELIARLAASVPVPLVLHGSSGVSDDGIASAITSGIRKVNVATHLNAALTSAVRTALKDDVIDPRKYLGPGRAAVAAEVRHLLGVIAAA